MRTRRSRLGMALAGAVAVAAGFGVAIVELFHFPKGTIWIVVAGAGLLAVAIRGLTR